MSDLNREDLRVLTNSSVSPSKGRKTDYSKHEESLLQPLARIIVLVAKNPGKNAADFLPEDLYEPANAMIEAMNSMDKPKLAGAAVKVFMTAEADNLDKPELFPAPKPRQHASVMGHLRSLCKDQLSRDELETMFGEGYKGKGKKPWAS